MREAAKVPWPGPTAVNTKENGYEVYSMVLVEWRFLMVQWRRVYSRTMCSQERCLLCKRWNRGKAKRPLRKRNQYRSLIMIYLLSLSIISTKIILNIKHSRNGCIGEHEALDLCRRIIIKWDQPKRAPASTNLSSKILGTPIEITIISKQIKVHNRKAFTSSHQIQALNQRADSGAPLHW